MQNDPYTYTDKMSPGTLKAVVEGMENADKLYDKLTTPWILIQGALDKLVDVTFFRY